MPKIKKTHYETITLSFAELEETLRKALELDKGFKMSARLAGDTLREYQLEVSFTKATDA